jgi:hypothetical protein
VGEKGAKPQILWKGVQEGGFASLFLFFPLSKSGEGDTGDEVDK